MNRAGLFLVIVGVFLAGMNRASAQEGSTGSRSPAFGWSSKRAEVRAQTRWSLEDWLKQRERMKWSDLWLQMNSPSPYEFFLSISQNLVPGSIGRGNSVRYGAGAYVTIFGLEYEYNKVISPEDHARFHARLFGNSLQNTNLTFHAGVRKRTEPETFHQWYLGFNSDLYLTKVFGMSFLYRYHLKSITVQGLGTPFGHRLEGGPFLEYGFLRILGRFLVENENTSAGPRGAYGWSGGVQAIF